MSRDFSEPITQSERKLKSIINKLDRIKKRMYNESVEAQRLNDYHYAEAMMQYSDSLNEVGQLLKDILKGNN